MTTYELRRATVGDVIDVCTRATNECVSSNMDLLHMEPLDAAARLAVASREPTTWVVNGEPICVFGVASYAALSTTGYPWIYWTASMSEHKAHFIRRCRQWTEYNLEEWERLEAFVDPNDQSAVKWMRFMGFTLDEPEPLGPDGELFHRAHLERTIH